MTETLRTVATKVRFHVDYAEGSVVGAPTDLCVKGYFDPHPRPGSEREPLFYERIAPHLDVRVPPWAYSGVDTETGHAIVVMEDLVAAGCQFLGALSPYGVNHTRQSLDQIARLNASDWGGTSLGDTPWLSPRMEMLFDAVPPKRIAELLTDPRKERVPADLLDAERIIASLGALIERAQEWPRALIHADLHAGNIFLDNAGRPGLIDWQLVQVGPVMLDFTYHVVATLTIEERRRHEEELLEHYLDRLRAHGVDAPAWEAAWEQYQLSCAYGFFLWAITQFVDPPVIYEFFARLGTAVADHDSFGRLGV